MKEYLDYVRVSKEGENLILIVQLDGGGAAACFTEKDDSIEVCGKLRRLADVIERGIEERSFKR
jgi:predicted GTPase